MMQYYLFTIILYKYILLVRVICEKYRLRGEANIPSRYSGEGHLTVLETGISRKYSSLTGYICLIPPNI